MSKLVVMQELRDSWISCTKCELSKSRRNVVFGSGNPDAHILFIGEAPGEDEDRAGLPFVGKAGETLDTFLKVAQLDRDVDIFMTNVVGCRPTMKVEDDRTKAVTIENRNPTKIEKAACKDRLESIIYELDPMIIVALGRVAFQALTGKSTPMGQCRGEVHTMTFRGHYTDIHYPVLPMYHPTFLDSSYNFQTGGPWGQTSKDMKLLCSIVDKLREMYFGTPIPSRKQEIDEEDSK